MSDSIGRNSIGKVRAALRERGEATRPQLAAATGLSAVSVGRAVQQLCASGEAELRGESGAGRGRPAELYRFKAESRIAALFKAERTGNLCTGQLELLDCCGQVKRREEARFALLHAQSLDDLLDELCEGRRLSAITLSLPSDLTPSRLAAHLRGRFGCPVRRISRAMALADETEGSLTLYLPPGEAPEACLRRGGRLQPCGRLQLLPLPADWASLDPDDHTLLEEMVARLLLITVCTLAPERLTAYAPFWTERLMNRIRYNFSTKMRGYPAPKLAFRPLRTRQVDEGLRRLSLAD